MPRARPSGRLVGVLPTHHRHVNRRVSGAPRASRPCHRVPPLHVPRRYVLQGGRRSTLLGQCRYRLTALPSHVHRLACVAAVMPPLHSPLWRCTLLGQCYRGADASPPIRRAASLASCVGYCRTRPLAALSAVPGVLAPATLVRHVAVASVGRYRYPVGRCRLPPPRMGTQRTCATTMLPWLRRGAPHRVGACSTGRAARAAESTRIVVVGCHSAPRRHHA